jgi:hypothetical protein
LNNASPEVKQAAEAADVPKDLRESIAQEMAEDPSAAWDEALHRLI